ncbi:hypothetical protein E3E12_07505 [Formicincola oecophyllae]|uniref:Nuclease n=1 Tax=Formicincola oecophyllae TaxID=2558361 RepID=A0A4Y6UAF6_9PROT|nr:hypothetical protein E3E12_07505 [Formicincola oecophyllae]
MGAGFALALTLVAGTAAAAPCLYDITPLPVFKGTVSRVTYDGVLFSDGTDVVLPESLLAYPRMEERLAVRGLRARRGKKVWALAIDGNPPICPSVADVQKGAYPGSPAYDVIEHGVNPGL